ncbi:hypothetical protein, partial [Ralstonia pseudosolanacearum]
ASPAQSPEIPLASRVQACCRVINLTVFACPELQGQLHRDRYRWLGTLGYNFRLTRTYLDFSPWGLE